MPTALLVFDLEKLLYLNFNEHAENFAKQTNCVK